MLLGLHTAMRHTLDMSKCPVTMLWKAAFVTALVGE